MSSVVQEVVGKRRYLVRFHDGGEKDMSSKQLTVMVVRSELYEEVEEGYVWCGTGGCWEEEVFGEVPGWVGEGDVVKPAHHCGRQE